MKLLTANRLQPGLDLDSLIAEAIGWTKIEKSIHRGSDFYLIGYPPVIYSGKLVYNSLLEDGTKCLIPQYSVDNNALEVAINDLVRFDNASSVRITRTFKSEWYMSIWSEAHDIRASGSHTHHALAVCEAILNYAEKLNEKRVDG